MVSWYHGIVVAWLQILWGGGLIFLTYWQFRLDGHYIAQIHRFRLGSRAFLVRWVKSRGTGFTHGQRSIVLIAYKRVLLDGAVITASEERACQKSGGIR